MPAFLTHFRILELAAESVAQNMSLMGALTAPGPTYRPPKANRKWSLSQWAYLGSMGPDIAYFPADGISNNAMPQFSWLADALHYKKANAFVANFLESLGEYASQGRTAPPKPGPYSVPAVGYTFVLGMLAHMAGDIILHPYINGFGGLTAAKKHAIPDAGHTHIGDPAANHRFVEVNQDVYLAHRVYGAPALSDGPGDSVWNSWSEFLEDVLETNERQNLNWLLDTINQTGTKTYPYGKGKLTVQDGIKALQTMIGFVLDFGYDTAGMGMSFISDKAETSLVQHGWRDRDYERYLEAAARVTVGFWNAAEAYAAACISAKGRPAEKERTKFFNVVRNFNLDTGYAPRVYDDGSGNVHIRYDHSWALFL